MAATTANGALDAISARGADVASASTINLTTATGRFCDVTGTTTITAITLADGLVRMVRFSGALTLTHGSSLILPTSANITTAAGDVAVFAGYAAGVVRCVSYSPFSGIPLAIGTLNLGTDPGSVTVLNSAISSSSSSGTPHGYVDAIDSTAILSRLADSDGSGSIRDPRVIMAGIAHNTVGSIYLPTQFDKATSTALSTITGFSMPLRSNAKYRFRARLFITADATGGHKYAVGGTVTPTAIVYQINSIKNSTNAFVLNSRQTALAGSAGEASATTYYTEIVGTVDSNVGGTLTIQFAQNVASGTSSVLLGSEFEVEGY